NGKDLSISDFLSPYFPLRPGWSEGKSFYLSAKDKTGNVIISVCVMPGWGGPVILLGIVEKKEMEIELITAKDIYEKLKTEGHIAIYGIYFDFDKADIKPESEPTLKEIARFLRENPEIRVYIVGHTDNVGKLDYNMELSRKRAENVVKELVNKYGISKERLKAFGVGPLAPVSSNDTEEGRAKNRRVEIVKE
ncbi:MAG: OmpA family protein, partial [Candidatus Omnitrophica bacterium]|nr:OmpA family protein [Candidatus Omnitrophota bacterium]